MNTINYQNLILWIVGGLTTIFYGTSSLLIKSYWGYIKEKTEDNSKKLAEIATTLNKISEENINSKKDIDILQKIINEIKNDIHNDIKTDIQAMKVRLSVVESLIEKN